MRHANLFVLVVVFLVSISACAKPINVSCTDSVNSLQKLREKSFPVNCPVNCTNGAVWGTNNLFTTDSAICVAAIHEGVVTAEGGMVKVKLLPGQASYGAGSKNGVATRSWDSYGSSFSVSK
ncbi:MAG: hypothetical protein HY541_05065 [Deltaproteobacteria bacterium]|nr:hypothetical protein [Deltaproteobacteria bacterium]